MFDLTQRQSRSRTTRRLWSTLGLVVALVGALIAGPVASASAAVVYWYKPSHPMNLSPKPVEKSDCTGAWGIRSSLNYPYFLTAGHCFETGDTVYGTTGAFGGVANTHLHLRDGYDTAIVAPNSDVDGWQEIPGVGLTVGKMGNDYLTTSGSPIAMQGARSGRTYGTQYGSFYRWANNQRVACGSYASTGGDSGSPVFIHQGDRVYAAGVHVGTLTYPSGLVIHCFVTIDDLLMDWNAWLPVFSSAAAKSPGAKVPDVLLGPAPSSAADKLPIRYVGKPVYE